MLLNRFQIVQLVQFASIAALAAGERPDVAAAQAFLAILYDEATADARATYAQVAQSDDPWHAFLPVTYEPALAVRSGLVVKRGPLALILALGKDETDPNVWSDRGHYVPDPGTDEGAGWAPLFDALSNWSAETISGAAHDLGWQVPSESTRPDELESPEIPRSHMETPPDGPEGPSGTAPVPVPPAVVAWYQRDALRIAAAGVTAAGLVGVGFWLLRRPA